MRVKGTLGIVADAAKANLLDFVETVEALQRTSMHLDQEVVDEVIREYKRSREDGANQTLILLVRLCKKGLVDALAGTRWEAGVKWTHRKKRVWNLRRMLVSNYAHCRYLMVQPEREANLRR
jgi:hypothetical protein